MKSTNFRKYIRVFVVWYAVLFFLSTFIRNDNVFQSVWTYIVPAIGAIIFILFLSPDSIWPIYKKGDKVWWSTYGDHSSTSNSSINQKRMMQLISYFCFLFTLEILNKKAPIYLSLKDYIAPAVFSLIMVLFLSRDAVWPIYREKSAEAAS